MNCTWGSIGGAIKASLALIFAVGVCSADAMAGPAAGAQNDCDPALVSSAASDRVAAVAQDGDDAVAGALSSEALAGRGHCTGGPRHGLECWAQWECGRYCISGPRQGWSCFQNWECRKTCAGGSRHGWECSVWWDCPGGSCMENVCQDSTCDFF